MRITQAPVICSLIIVFLSLVNDAGTTSEKEADHKGHRVINAWIPG